MTISRRQFQQTSFALGSAALLGGVHSQVAAEDAPAAMNKLNIAIMGVNGRGSALAQTFLAQSNCEIAAICDVDTRALEKAIAAVSAKQERKPQAFGDIRKLLEDKSIDALIVAAPNHWHAPATILATGMGKHVYVEKPCSQTAEEGELAVAAARKHNRVVTMGTQRRSFPGIAEGIKRLHDGVIGPVHYARCWYNNLRGTIGKGKQVEVPTLLNYELWQGPAPQRPYKDNLIHYNWHWHWHWGNGELGNNGVHGLDVARWGMQVDYPQRVTSSGGRYRWDDDQETPDTHVVAFDFPGKKTISWEGLSWSPLGPLDDGFGVSFHGEQGSMAILGSGYKIFDLKNKEIEAKSDSGSDGLHVANFLACMRSGERPNADIEIAHKSALLCHLGNIAHRVGRTLNCDVKTGRIVDDADAMKLWGREYRSGWEPKV